MVLRNRIIAVWVTSLSLLILTLGVPGCGPSAPGLETDGLSAKEVYARLEQAMTRPEQVFHTAARINQEAGPLSYQGNMEVWAAPEQGLARQALEFTPKGGGTRRQVMVLDDGVIYPSSYRGMPQAKHPVPRCPDASALVSTVVGCFRLDRAGKTLVEAIRYEGVSAVALVTEVAWSGSDERFDVKRKLYLDAETYLPIALEINGTVDYGEVSEVRSLWTYENDFLPLDSLPDDFFDPSSVDHVEPEATPTATPAATLTPEDNSFFRDPTPTPLPLSGLKEVKYDLPSYRISDLSDERFVSIGPDGEVYLVDIESGEREQLTDDGHRKREAVLSGEYVAWIDQRRQIEIYYSGSRPPEGYAEDIFLYNLTTRELQRITEIPARRYDLSISGHRLVWADNRNELREHYTHADIYSYDIATGEEQPVAVAPGAQFSPSIHGNLVVWQDNRNSPARGTSRAGCGGCPDNRYDIYLYDFKTGRERPLVESQFFKGNPSIYGNHVVWGESHDDKGHDVYLLDLATGEERRLTDDGGRSVRPIISGNHVIWHRLNACDVLPIPQGYNTGVFAYNLNDGEVRQLSNYVEPRAIIHEDVVLIEEGCFSADRIYSVSLRGGH